MSESVRISLDQLLAVFKDVKTFAVRSIIRPADIIAGGLDPKNIFS